MKKAIKSTLVLTVAVALLAASVVFATACDTKKAVSSIEITTAPTLTEYVEGDLFNTAGMVVTAKYEDGTTEAVTGYTVAPGGALKPADTEVTVTYEGKTATQAIIVNANDMTLAVTKAPDKISYKSSETFNTDGMVVTAFYADGTAEEVTDYTLYPAERKLNVNDQAISISYGGVTIEQPVIVAADVSSAPTKAPIIYKAVGSADVGGQKANINFEFRDNGYVQGILESGQGAEADAAIAALLSFKGTWEQTDKFTVKLNDFKFDPKTILGLVDMIPEEMMTPELQAMIDGLAEMDIIDIKGCTTTATLSGRDFSFNAQLSAMGISVPLDCKGELPADMAFDAGAKIDAEFGDISGAKMKSGVPIVQHGSAERKLVIGGSALEGSTLKMNISSADEAKGVDLSIHAMASLKGDINEFFTLKVNGKEVTLAGELTSVSKYADLTATIDLIAGANTVELIWKQASSAKIDYFTFSAAVTLLNPTYGEI